MPILVLVLWKLSVNYNLIGKRVKGKCMELVNRCSISLLVLQRQSIFRSDIILP